MKNDIELEDLALYEGNSENLKEGNIRAVIENVRYETRAKLKND